MLQGLGSSKGQAGAPHPAARTHFVKSVTPVRVKASLASGRSLASPRHNRWHSPKGRHHEAFVAHGHFSRGSHGFRGLRPCGLGGAHCFRFLGLGGDSRTVHQWLLGSDQREYLLRKRRLGSPCPGRLWRKPLGVLLHEAEWRLCTLAVQLSHACYHLRVLYLLPGACDGLLLKGRLASRRSSETRSGAGNPQADQIRVFRGGNETVVTNADDIPHGSIFILFADGHYQHLRRQP